MLAKGSEYWILGGAVLTAFMGFFTPYALLGIVLTLSLFLFFRDPERLSESHNATDVVSPADGRVLKIQDNQLSIFMNTLNSSTFPVLHEMKCVLKAINFKN